jgi:UDP-3-O-[3-hydroxymyristoyl] glucosamine N-acyltransferase
MPVSHSLKEIAEKFGGVVVGDGDIQISRMSSLANAKQGELSFLANSKYRSLLKTTMASAVVVGQEDRDATTLPRIVADNPYAYFARVSTLLNPDVAVEIGVHPTAFVHASVKLPATVSIGAHAYVGAEVQLGEDVSIGPGCVVHERVAVGAHSRLHANVTIYPACEIGQYCVLFAGAVIGADGFGYAEENDMWVKIPQIGRVVIGDHVDVGANTTIDRGALDDTIVENGVKLDNLIQIGHNCRIGAHTVIAGCVGIAGSARIGRHCKIGGAAMILGHLEIADEVTISPGSMITRSVTKSDTYTALMPFQTHAEWLRTAVHIRHLDQMMQRIALLEKEIEVLKKDPS